MKTRNERVVSEEELRRALHALADRIPEDGPGRLGALVVCAVGADGIVAFGFGVPGLEPRALAEFSKETTNVLHAALSQGLSNDQEELPPLTQTGGGEA